VKRIEDQVEEERPLSLEEEVEVARELGVKIGLDNLRAIGYIRPMNDTDLRLVKGEDLEDATCDARLFNGTTCRRPAVDIVFNADRDEYQAVCKRHAQER
jgi:hypothetical protein